MAEPTLSDLILAYDRGKLVGAQYERIYRAGLVTMQGGRTQEGDKALINAYRHHAIRLQARVDALIAAGNRLARIPAATGADALPAKRQWREAVKKE